MLNTILREGCFSHRQLYYGDFLVTPEKQELVAGCWLSRNDSKNTSRCFVLAQAAEKVSGKVVYKIISILQACGESIEQGINIACPNS